eukprot:scaffold17484_cov22-Tisochrysis_lutea.AAC.1
MPLMLTVTDVQHQHQHQTPTPPCMRMFPAAGDAQATSVLAAMTSAVKKGTKGEWLLGWQVPQLHKLGQESDMVA